MTNISKSIFIDRPLEIVFQYASDYTKWEDWFEGVSDFKTTTETLRGNGARYTYQAKMMALSMQIETEIYNFVENKGWNGRAIKGMPHRTSWSFEQVRSATKMTYSLEYSIDIPLIGNWLDKTFLKPQWDRIIKNSLENLKHQLEKEELTV